MIKSLEIRNLQSWKRGIFNFVPGVNVIIGVSDSGKSAIIRAIRRVVWNRPLGDSFRSTWGGRTSIKLTTTDDITIKRVEDTEKYYELSTIDKPFKAIGTDVPQEIQEVLNLNEINLQRQHDNEFLLSQTPGEVAQHFNRMAHLEKIAIGQANIKKWVNQLKNGVISKEADLKKNESEYAQYTYLEKMEIDIEVLEKTEETRQTKQQSLSKLKSILKQVQQIQDDIEEKTNLLELEKPVNAILSLVTQRKEKAKVLAHLKEICREIKEKGHEIEKLEEVLTLNTQVNDLLDLYSSRKQKQVEYDHLKNIHQRIISNSQQIKLKETEYSRLHTEFEKAMGDMCILCGQSIKH